ncbi:hypothetical protein QP948_07590 [Corynebacterium bovis]|uniref:hypothetical protein n=1 Tax=Corynebacterium bovis TaxID=36808 RepID=UPI002549C5C9|nr:hypothetical protein [Corynebacterium bovis]MDK8511259.1 hypothetical protein [Corynebacterium bovis]
MARSLLVTPDLTAEEVDVDLSQATDLLGAPADGRLSVAFVEDGRSVACVYASSHSDPAAAGADGTAGTTGSAAGDGDAASPDVASEPNPLASMGRNEQDTGNSAFLSDPTRAICGTVLFTGADGGDLTDEDVETVRRGIRAVENYREDQPEEYRLWRDAVLNLRSR